MTEVRNILLIGPTGSGKSTLGNVLINRNENFEKVFEENGRTKETKIEEVEREGTKYRVIDTVG
jgi:predicted GTPase